jgi:hypothetical protein
VEIERRLQGVVEYMKWRSEDTLAVYQHYFDEQLDADTRGQFHRRMHEDVQQYLKERASGKRKKPTSHKNQNNVTDTSPRVIQLDDEPDLAFLYSLGGMA